MKLLLVKISSLGDVVHSFAFVNQLRAHRPDISVDWLVGDAYAELAKCAGGGKIWEFRRKKWGSGWWNPGVWMDIAGTVSAIRRERYDICLDLQGLLRSGLFTAFSGAGEKVGPSDAREGSRYLYHRLIPPGESPHAVHKLLGALEFFGVPRPESPSFEYAIPGEAEERASRIVSGKGIAGDYVVFHPGARWRTKMWPAARWRDLAKRVTEFCSLPVLVTGSTADLPLAGEIAEGMEDVYTVAGELGLLELSAVLKKAKLMVTVDSGPMHMAAAFNRPIVALFGPTSPQKTGPISKGGTRVVASFPECSPCFQRSCPKGLDCMAGISAEDVFASVADLMGKEAGK